MSEPRLGRGTSHSKATQANATADCFIYLFYFYYLFIFLIIFLKLVNGFLMHTEDDAEKNLTTINIDITLLTS